MSEDPITIKQLSKITNEKKNRVREKVDLLIKHFRKYPRGIRLVETAGGYRFETDPSYAPTLKKYYKSREKTKLSRAAMESLAIIAYKQPVTVPEINEIRSVDSGGVIHKLLERKLIKVLGRKNVVGKPLIYGTTKQFLARFSLNSIEDLPDFDEFLQIIGADTDSSRLKEEYKDHFVRSDNIETNDTEQNEQEEKTDD